MPSYGRRGGRRQSCSPVTLRRNRRAGRSTRPYPRQRGQCRVNLPDRRWRCVPWPRHGRQRPHGRSVTHARRPVTVASTATVTPHPFMIVPAVAAPVCAGQCADLVQGAVRSLCAGQRPCDPRSKIDKALFSVHMGLSPQENPGRRGFGRPAAGSCELTMTAGTTAGQRPFRGCTTAGAGPAQRVHRSARCAGSGAPRVRRRHSRSTAR